NDLPKLYLISHAHSHHLNPPPQLRFDLRNLPNPPKRIRDHNTGTSKRLQEWMEADPAFLARRDEIREEIKSGYRRVYTEQDFSGLELRVGIVCAMGRHRSVAMVEELSRMTWTGWDIEVQHQDVAKKRNSEKKTAGKGSRG
ncbi:hypothetical protein BDZ45DRAFT_553917, partial [Acephala macrosclerotiorum]